MAIAAIPRPGMRSILSALAVIGLSAACLVVPIDAEALGNAGYAGVFVLTLVTTGALVLPIPYLAVIAKAATLLDPVTVAVVAGVAAALGELSGYVLGQTGRALLGEQIWMTRLRGWMARHGFITVTVAAFIPNPAFDAVGILAGALGYRAWRFCAACFVGKTAKFLIITILANNATG